MCWAWVSGATMPSLQDVLAPFRQARGSANEAYDTAIPVINDAFRDLLQGVLAGSRDTIQQGNIQDRGIQRDLQAGQRQINAEGQHGAQDVSANGGDVAGSLEAELAAAVPGQNANLREGAALDRQLGNRLDQVTRQETRATREDAGLARASARSTAATNLESILQQIGVQEMGARQEYAALQQDLAQSGYSASQESQAAGMDFQTTIAQATNELARDALTAALQSTGSWTGALELVRADAQNLASGMNDYGVPIDPRMVLNIIRQLGPTLSGQSRSAQRRDTRAAQQEALAEQGAAGEDPLAFLQALGLG